MNNFEKIKAMNIDEMAEFLSRHVSCNFCLVNCPHVKVTNIREWANLPSCKQYFKQWLESEVRE